jgi:hypothetical protein
MKRILAKLTSLKPPSSSASPDVAPDSTPSRTETMNGTLMPAARSQDSQTEQISNNKPQINSALESLPAELRIQILSHLELGGLSALVHASPVFHEDYLQTRKLLLSECLEVTLPSAIIDACSAYQTGSVEFAKTRTEQTVTQFLTSYQNRRCRINYSIVTENFTEDDVLGIVTFYFSIIKPLVRCYTSWAMANLAHETKDVQSNEPLSRTEEMRLLRSLYRFQLCCNLFGKGSHEPLRSQREFESVDILRLFVCLFEPWEIEEVVCIYTFAQEKLDQVFRDIYWDVHEDNPKFDGQRPPTPDGAFDLDNYC